MLYYVYETMKAWMRRIIAVKHPVILSIIMLISIISCDSLMSKSGGSDCELLPVKQTVGDDSNPSSFCILNGRLYFAAWDATSGRELFVFDGANPPAVVYDIKHKKLPS